MRDVVNKIRIDLNNQRTRLSVSICKGDTISRTIYITLLNSGIVYDIPDDAIATLLATKPDGKVVYNDCTICGNEIAYTVTNQLIAVAGDVECQIKLTAGDGTEITSPAFIIRIYERLFDETVLESTNDYSALQSYCIRAENAAKGIEATANNISERVNVVSTECTESKNIANSAAYILLLINLMQDEEYNTDT